MYVYLSGAGNRTYGERLPLADRRCLGAHLYSNLKLHILGRYLPK